MIKYKKVQLIGKGAFGYAVLVRNTDDPHNFYVMKIIDTQKMNIKQQQDAMNEVKVLEKLNNPFVIKYKESFKEKKVLCIVMDFADGGDLYKLINEYKKKKSYIPENVIKRIFTQICLALLHVHSNKILHRDLKTQNIFLTKKQNVKLGDFGISRVLQHTYDVAKTAIGTPYYLSPEICQEKPYNQKSDIWSIGCILYEMLSLNHAFDGASMKQLILRILEGNYPPPPSHYSSGIKLLLSKMLNTKPEDRPSLYDILADPIVKDELRRIEREYGHLEELKVFKLKNRGKSTERMKTADSRLKDKRSKSFLLVKDKDSNRLGGKRKFEILKKTDKKKEDTPGKDINDSKLSILKQNVQKNLKSSLNNLEQEDSEKDHKIYHNFNKQKQVNDFKEQNKFRSNYRESRDKRKLEKTEENKEETPKHLNSRISTKLASKSQKRIEEKPKSSSRQLFSKKYNFKSNQQDKQSKSFIELSADKKDKSKLFKNADKRPSTSANIKQKQPNKISAESAFDHGIVRRPVSRNSKLKPQIDKDYFSNQIKPIAPKNNDNRMNKSVVHQIDEKFEKDKKENQVLRKSSFIEHKIEDKPLQSKFLFDCLPYKMDETDPLTYKIEALRIYLERELTLDRLLYIYNSIKDYRELKELSPTEEKFIPSINTLIFLENKVFANV